MNTNAENLRWDVLGYPTNPIPGDTDEISRIALRYKTLYDTFAEMVRALQNLTDQTSSSRGQWVDEFLRKTDTLSNDLGAFANALEEVYLAVEKWEGELGAHIDSATRVVLRAAETYDSLQQKLYALQQAQLEFEKSQSDFQSLSTYDPEYRKAAEDFSNARNVVQRQSTFVSNYSADLENDRRDAEQIIESYRSDGHQIAITIADAEHYLPSESTLQRVIYSEGWDVTEKVLNIAANAAGLIAVAFGGWVVVAAGTIAVIAWLAKQTRENVKDGFSLHRLLVTDAADNIQLFLSVLPAGKLLWNAKAASNLSDGLSFCGYLNKETQLNDGLKLAKHYLSDLRINKQSARNVAALRDYATRMRSVSTDASATIERSANSAERKAKEIASSLKSRWSRQELTKGIQNIVSDFPIGKAGQHWKAWCNAARSSSTESDALVEAARQYGWEGISSVKSAKVALSLDEASDLAQLSKPLWNGSGSAPSPKESASKFANLCKNELLNGLTSAYVDAADGLAKAF